MSGRAISDNRVLFPFPYCPALKNFSVSRSRRGLSGPVQFLFKPRTTCQNPRKVSVTISRWDDSQLNFIVSRETMLANLHYSTAVLFTAQDKFPF